MEYLIGEMFWFQEIKEAKQSDPDHVWSHQHITGSCAEGLCIPNSFLYKSGNDISEMNWMAILGSDLDVMPVKEAFVTINDEQIPIFDIIQSGNDPRYVFLTPTEQWKKLNPGFRDTVYLHQSFLLAPGFLNKILGLFAQKEKKERKEEFFHDKIHGPARQLFFEALEDCMQLDTTEVFKYPKAWPEVIGPHLNLFRTFLILAAIWLLSVGASVPVNRSTEKNIEQTQRQQPPNRAKKYKKQLWTSMSGEYPFLWLKINLAKACLQCSDTSSFYLR